jgi:hypothetical protein
LRGLFIYPSVCSIEHKALIRTKILAQRTNYSYEKRQKELAKKKKKEEKRQRKLEKQKNSSGEEDIISQPED